MNRGLVESLIFSLRGGRVFAPAILLHSHQGVLKTFHNIALDWETTYWETKADFLEVICISVISKTLFFPSTLPRDMDVCGHDCRSMVWNVLNTEGHWNRTSCCMSCIKSFLGHDPFSVSVTTSGPHERQKYNLEKTFYIRISEYHLSSLHTDSFIWLLWFISGSWAAPAHDHKWFVVFITPSGKDYIPITI